MISFMPFGYITAGAVIVAAVMAAVAGFQTWRLDRCQKEFMRFQERVKTEGEAAEKRAKETEERHRRLKHESDRQLASARARIRDLNRQLLDARAGGGYLPAPASPTASADRACFDRAELERALRQFDQEVSGIVAEGDQARVALDAAKEWATKLKGGT